MAKKTKKWREQPLLSVIKGLGLSFKDVADLTVPFNGLSEQTVSDIARGMRKGHERSRTRILNGLNTFAKRPKDYEWDDLYDTPRDD